MNAEYKPVFELIRKIGILQFLNLDEVAIIEFKAEARTLTPLPQIQQRIKLQQAESISGLLLDKFMDPYGRHT